MSEFERLIDDREADPELARLFRAGRAPAPIPRTVFQRSRTRLLAVSAAPFGVLAALQHAALGAALGTAVAVAAAVPRFYAQRAAPTPSVAASSVSTAAPRKPAPVALPLPPPPEPAASLAPTKPTNAAPPASVETENPLLRETALLERARTELERRPATALRLLSEHEREFPNGALVVERDFLTVAALLALGERPRAVARAQALRARSPGSLYEQRLDQLLGEGATP